MLTSKYTRIISIVGVILLLTLQYIWIRNAYQMVERDIMEKSKVYLKESINENIFKRLGEKVSFAGISEPTSINESVGPKTKILAKMDIKQFDELNIGLQDFLNKDHKPCSIKSIDTIFQKKIFDQYGFIPKYKLRIINNSTKFELVKKKIKKSKEKDLMPEMSTIYENDSCKVYDFICGKTIFIKLDSYNSIELVLTSPAASVINKSKYIFFISILLVLLIGVILVFQFKSMMKDKEFTAFMKDYTRMLAHELRTPINGIHMLTSRLMSDNLMDPKKRTIYHKENLNLCSKLLLAIDNILLVARSEQSNLSIFKSNTNIQLFIEGIVDKYRDNYFQPKVLNIVTHYEPKGCMAYIDPDLMENVLINLIENAIKYSNETVDILISCSVENGRLLLSIRDNGFGIGKDDQKNIFKIFRRGTKIEGKQIKGFGIGLYYVQKVIEAHRGKVNILSEEGIGSEFIIDIPNRFQ